MLIGTGIKNGKRQQPQSPDHMPSAWPLYRLDSSQVPLCAILKNSAHLTRLGNGRPPFDLADTYRVGIFVWLGLAYFTLI